MPAQFPEKSAQDAYASLPVSRDLARKSDAKCGKEVRHTPAPKFESRAADVVFFRRGLLCVWLPLEAHDVHDMNDVGINTAARMSVHNSSVHCVYNFCCINLKEKS